MNHQSEKFSEIDIKGGGNYSPKGGSVINLGLDDDEDVDFKPNHIEKISLALAHSLKDTVKPKGASRSAKSDNEDSVSMRDELDNISEVYNDKLKRELELTLIDLQKLRGDYDHLFQVNMEYK